jgi:prepilin-type N-terminal cleavage/methylation domain-containing protein
MTKQKSRRARTAFTLIEMLVVVAILGSLAVLGLSAGSRALREANKADSLARIRTMGQAILLHAADHDQTLPGPLWPGQVMEYDPTRDGRLVRDVAAYLDLPQGSERYVATQMIPKAFRRSAPGIALKDLRVYVMNEFLVNDGQTNLPFGSLTAGPPIPSMRLGSFTIPSEAEHWMIRESDQLLADLADKSWRTSTPPRPVHGNTRLALGFDGAARVERVNP